MTKFQRLRGIMKRYLILLCIALALSLAFRSVAAGARYLTIDKIIRAPVYVLQNGSVRQARVGSRLYEGNRLFVPEGADARIALDLNQGYLLLQPPIQFEVQRLRLIDGCAYSRLLVSAGYIYKALRTPRCITTQFNVDYLSDDSNSLLTHPEFAQSSDLLPVRSTER